MSGAKRPQGTAAAITRGRTGALAYDEARRIAASIAKLPELVRRKADSP
jgi:hypothetical protein